MIGIRHGEKMYETLLTNEECANAIDMGNFYRVPCDKRDLNYDKYFKDGDVERNKLTEFNSSNTELWTVDVKDKLLKLNYIREELIAWRVISGLIIKSGRSDNESSYNRCERFCRKKPCSQLILYQRWKKQNKRSYN